MSSAEDRVLGSYRLLERIGRGGMGDVYLGQHLKLGRQAAVKILPVNLANEADFLKRFEREAASAASLEHPNILPVWDYGEQDGAPYLVMPYIRSGTLKDRLAKGPLSHQEMLAYLRQMAEALDYAHERGIIHRDVKPANMLLDDRGRLYLSDFGIAKALEGSEGLTRTGVGVGTPEYMAPEQAQGRADSRSDLYALGVILYQLVTGRVPYSGNSTVEVLMKHMQEPLPLVPLQNAPQLPPGLPGVLQKALAKNPNERYQTGQALVEAVSEALAGGYPAGMPAGNTAQTLAPASDATVVGSTPPPGWSPPGGVTPPPGGTPPGASTAASWAPSVPPGWSPPALPGGTTPAPPAVRGQGNRKLLLGGGIAALVALLLCGVVAAFALSRGGGKATPTVQAAATNTAPAAGATAPSTAVTGAASPTTGTGANAPTAAPTTAPRANAPALSFPNGGKYSTLEPVGRRGGKITEVTFDDGVTLNPMIATDNASTVRYNLIFNSLVGLNPDNGLPYPELVTEVPTLDNGGIAKDGLTYTFKLRKDVKWHDGKPFTARDVVYTYTTMMKPEVSGPTMVDLNERVEAVTAPNEFTVVFKLKKVVAPFLTSNMYPIVPEHILGTVSPAQLKDHPFSYGDPKATIGTGPFKFQEWIKGDHLTLVKNANYFLGDPALDRIDFKPGGRATSLVADLQAGTIDLARVGLADYETLSKQPNLTTVTYDTYGFEFYTYQLDPAKTTLFADKQVRQALAYAVNREEILKDLYGNLGTLAQGTMPVPSWAYAPEQIETRYSYDPQKAEQLLDAAGWAKGPDGIRAKGGQKLAFTITAGEGNAVATYLQNYWQAIGVEATPRPEAWSTVLDRITKTHDFEVAVISFNWNIDPDQTAMWGSKSYPASFNFNKYANPKVDELLAQAVGELDQDKRRQMYIEMQNILMDDVPSFILSFSQNAVAVNKRVHNYKPNPINTNWNAHLWWVDDGK